MTSNHLLLFRIAELMLEHEQHVVPVDLLFDDEKIGDFVKSIQIDSPYQQMLLEGMLTEMVKEQKLFVSFSVEGYFHHVLGHVIYNSSLGKSPLFFYDLLQSNRLMGLHEGISNTLLLDVRTGSHNNLISLIENSNKYHVICIKPLAAIILHGKNEHVLDALIKQDSEDIYALFLKVLKFLNQNNKHSGIEKFWLFFKAKSNQTDIFNSTFNKSMLLIKSMPYQFNQEQFDQLIRHIFSSKKVLFPVCSSSDQQALNIELNNIFVSKGLLKESFEFSNYAGLYGYSEKILADNYYNFLYPLLELGQFHQAEVIFNNCLPDNQSNGYFLNWSGWIYQSWFELKSKQSEHLEKGIQLYEKATQFIENDYGKYSIHKYQNLENLGYAYSLKGDYHKSCIYLDQAIDILQKTYQTDTTYLLGNPYEMKAVSLNAIGKYEEALQYSFKSDRCKLLQITEDSPEMAWNYYDKSKIYHNMGKLEEAKNSLQKALNIREASLGKENMLTIQTKKELEKISL